MINSCYLEHTLKHLHLNQLIILPIFNYLKPTGAQYRLTTNTTFVFFFLGLTNNNGDLC